MNDDFEQRVRDMLRAESGRAPDDYPVVQNVLREVHGAAVAPARPRWRTWMIPVVAAGAVAAVAATVVGVQSFRPSARHRVTVGDTGAPSASATDSVQPGPSVSTSPSAGVNAATSTAPAAALSGYHATDLTFVGATAWALAAPACPSGGDCGYTVVESRSGGAWTPLTALHTDWAPASCADPVCRPHIRFATDKVGYVFSQSTFATTADGGRTWTRRSGTAAALETLDGNVIRVETDCFPGCPVTVQTAPIGSDSWVTHPLPGQQLSMASKLILVRVQGAAYLELYGHTAGGAQDATSRLFVSTDDGVTWAAKGEPCPQVGGGSAGNEVDSVTMAAGGGGVAVACAPRGGSSLFVIWTGYSANDFQAPGRSVGNAFTGPVAVSGKTVLLSTPDGLYRSTDTGAVWSQVNVRGLAGVQWLGFETLTDARALSADGSTIWTTHDTGATWTPTPFP